MHQPSLFRATVRAGLWTLAGHGSSQALRLLGNLLLTRLLVPESFGLMSVATVIMVGVWMFSDLGLRQVLVRSPRAGEPEFVNTVWTLQILQAGAVAALMLIVALGLAYAQHATRIPAGSTYASPDLPWLIAGLSLAALLAGSESTRLAIAEKEQLIRPVVLIELGSQAAGLVAMCGVALVHPTVYVLLVGALVSGVTKVIASHRLPVGVANRLHLSWPIAREVCKISSWIVVSSALTFMSVNFDKLILAGLLGSNTMGQYVIAALLVGAAVEVVTRISSRVAYPAITKAYEINNAGLVHSYYQTRIPTDAFCLLVGAFLFWFGPDIVRLLYDDRYQQAGEFLRILAVTLLGARYAVVPYMYLLLGRTSLMAAEQAFRFGGLVVGVSIGYALNGTIGAIWGVALGQLAGSMAGIVLFQPRLGLLSMRREMISLAVFVSAFGLFGYSHP
jgi:O-antigen/teichoic acid export membrane protein